MAERVNIRITGVDKDGNVPLEIQRELVGMTLSAVYTKEQAEQVGVNGLPEGCRLALASEVVMALRVKGKCEEAAGLKRLMRDQWSLYVFRKESFELV